MPSITYVIHAKNAAQSDRTVTASDKHAPYPFLRDLIECRFGELRPLPYHNAEIGITILSYDEEAKPETEKYLNA